MSHVTFQRITKRNWHFSEQIQTIEYKFFSHLFDIFEKNAMYLCLKINAV
jgi:hypothetical protein